jgi:excinuclease Cho
VVYASELDFSLQSDLYGLFANRRAALRRCKKLPTSIACATG